MPALIASIKHGVLWSTILIAALLSIVPAKAQKSTSPKYDAQTEAKFKGTISEVKLPPKGSEKEIAYLVLNNGTDSLDIYLCPKSFLDDMGISFEKGDEIALTGSKIRHGEADLILAREIVKGDDTIILRDDKGNPAWSWHR